MGSISDRIGIAARIAAGPKGVKTVDLPPEFYSELADTALFRVLDMFKTEGRPRDHFWKVVEVADNAGVYELTSEEKIDSVVADARRQIEQRIPWPPEEKNGTQNDRMRQAVDDDARCKNWDSNQWAKFLGCRADRVRTLTMWRSLQQMKKAKHV